MPEEVLALVIVISFLTFIFTIIHTTQKYKLKKFEQESGSKTDDSLTTSELRRMIEEAVSDSTTSMMGDLDAMSVRLDEIDGGVTRGLLEDERAPHQKTVGRPVRQRQR